MRNWMYDIKPPQKDLCKFCGLRAEVKYRLNDGLYCKKCLDIGLHLQKFETDEDEN